MRGLPRAVPTPFGHLGATACPWRLGLQGNLPWTQAPGPGVQGVRGRSAAPSGFGNAGVIR